MLFRSGQAYLGVRPSTKSIRKRTAAVSDRTRRSSLGHSVPEVVTDLNRMLIGWANYFRLGCVSPAYAVVQRHTCRRLRQWLRHKFRQQHRGVTYLTEEQLCHRYGLIYLPQQRRDYLKANT